MAKKAIAIDMNESLGDYKFVIFQEFVHDYPKRDIALGIELKDSEIRTTVLLAIRALLRVLLDDHDARIIKKPTRGRLYEHGCCNVEVHCGPRRPHLEEQDR